MVVKFAFLLISLQLCHFGLSTETPQVLAQINDSESCVATCNNFPIRIGSKLYRIETTQMVTWFQAANNCRKLGGYLINIESSKEMDLIVAITPSERFWTSSNCLAKDNTFISLTSGVAMPYNKWAAGQPQHKANEEDCVEIVKGSLSPVKCESLLNYVCQANVL